MPRTSSWLHNLDGAGTGVFAVDSLQRIRIWNRSATLLTGHSQRETLGARCYEVIAGRRGGCPWCRANCPVQRRFRQGGLPVGVDLVVRTSQGREVRLDVSVVAAGRSSNPLAVHFLREALPHGSRLRAQHAGINHLSGARDEAIAGANAGRNELGIVYQGLCLLDCSLDVTYANCEAVRILTFGSGDREAPHLLTNRRIESLLGAHSLNTIPLPARRWLQSGRRLYRCELSLVDASPACAGQPCAVLVMRRVDEWQLRRRSVTARCQLTPRQGQAVALLAEGLTGKEIGQRMGISPNTVKALLRLVMAKLKVTTRPGILGKILALQSHDQTPTRRRPQPGA